MKKNDTLDTVVEFRNFQFFYGQTQALKDVHLDICRKKVTALIGPSGCGKSTLLRCINRMNDLVPGISTEGLITLDGEDIYSENIELTTLRRRVGMVFQRPNPFPKSIYENVAFGLRIQGEKNKSFLNDKVEWAIKAAGLWEEVESKLHTNALSLSGGQQQRLVIARAIAINPEVLLLDEPASALDPLSTLRIEELIHQLKEKYSIVIVTHNMQQATRVSDYSTMMYLGEVKEFNTTDELFTNPQNERTQNYISGKFG